MVTMKVPTLLSYVKFIPAARVHLSKMVSRGSVAIAPAYCEGLDIYSEKEFTFHISLRA